MAYTRTQHRQITSMSQKWYGYRCTLIIDYITWEVGRYPLGYGGGYYMHTTRWALSFGHFSLGGWAHYPLVVTPCRCCVMVSVHCY